MTGKEPAPKFELFAFPLDIEGAQSHLRQDMRDDWFPDVLLFEDLFSDQASLRETLASLLTEANGNFPASRRVLRDIPKARLGLRYSLETDFYDRLVYQGVCSYLLPFYDPVLSHRVLGHRYNSEAKRAKYLFKNRIDLWKTYEGLTHLCVAQGGVLLATDLVNYFENITKDSIIESLLSLLPEVSASGSEKARIRNAIVTLDDLLARWCYQPSHGLPQNRDASSFLANVVLTKVDRAMERKGYDYFRYVDDIRVCCGSDREARAALNFLIEELRCVGMNINGAKTSLLTRTSENLDDYFPGRDDRVATIDNMWRSRSKRVISRSVPLLNELLSDVIRENSTQSRQFRFLVNRIRQLRDADIFNSEALISEEFLSLMFVALDTQAASTDQFCSVLRGVPFSNPIFKRIADKLIGEDQPVFQWQSHHLWILLAEVGYVSDELIEKAFSSAKSEPNTAHAGAMFIYLGQTRAHHKLASLVDDFSATWTYQVKRCFLIACQRLEPEQMKSMVSKLDIRLRGTVSRLRKNTATRDNFVLRSKPTPVDELYDQISPYL